MKSLFIAGNWKSNKTASEAGVWLQKFNSLWQPSQNFLDNTTVILCVPFTLLSFLKYSLMQMKLPIQLGAQDVSPFPEGAYTGEVSARQVKELADWVIIGHSERRKYFSETDALLNKKVDEAKKAGLKIIYCVPDEQTVIPHGVDAVAYEPVWAIGTGKAEIPENAAAVIAKIKANFQVNTVIYGGSVTPENVKLFTSNPMIDGVLPGGASLDPNKFWELLNQTNI